MKRTWLTVVCSVALASSAFAGDGFPEGNYSGTGIKQFEDGRKLSYELEMAIEKSAIAFTYFFQGKEPVKFSLRMTFGKNGFFKVGTLGTGYCGNESCYWSVKLGPDVVEQWTLVFRGGTLFKTGSLVSPKGANWWEEHLVRK